MTDKFNPFEFKQQFNQQQTPSQMPKGMKKLVTSLIVVGVILVLFTLLISSFTFTVGEREQVVITQFDRIVRIVVDDINSPSIQSILTNPRYTGVRIEQGKGLFFKLPFIQNVRTFSNMLMTYDSAADEVFTLDKKKILVDNNAQWRIENPALFMQSMGTISAAHQRIDEFIYSRMREEIGKIDAKQLVADKEYVGGMVESVRNYVDGQMSPYGVRVVDIRIKRTEYPDETKPSIYEQMRSERQAVATQYRADGQRDARRILAEANRTATIIEAQAYETAEKTRGEGDGEALQIYADAFNVDPEFYGFWRSLQAYSKIIDPDTTIFINPNSDLMKYLYSPN